ncbi:MAG: hypothetical protein M4579_007501 [Chaenotheca gracillima]|nr:MAG: hypothetical protein M4579_007501 [Chaenotheca gracillima]
MIAPTVSTQPNSASSKADSRSVRCENLCKSVISIYSYSNGYVPSTYSKIVQKCFDDCVNDFTTKSLTTREEGCVVRCVDKWLKGQERVSTRFQELNAEMMQGGRPGGQIPGR